MKDAARRRVVIAGLKARLEPLGFAFASESEESFRFTRPLKLGGDSLVGSTEVGQVGASRSLYYFRRAANRLAVGAGTTAGQWHDDAQLKLGNKGLYFYTCQPC